MDDNIHTMHCPTQTILITDIANEISQAGMVETAQTHLMLLEFIPAVDDQLRWMVFFQHQLDEFLPEGAGSTGNQDNLILPIERITHLNLPGPF
jgi:hypothetical protein